MYNLQSSESTGLCHLIHKMITSEMKKKAPKSYVESQMAISGLRTFPEIESILTGSKPVRISGWFSR